MSDIETRARNLFLQALDQQPDQIARFLDSACDGDDELRQRVQKLLDAHNEAGEFLASSALKETDIRNPPEPDLDGFPETTASMTTKPGTSIGPYKLLEQIGEGGMGSVWVASQSEPIKRRVAIKLVKAGMDTGQVLARFEAERQALAMMDHPNIARVLDGGMTEHGRPYFAMEYVKGVPLTEYCDNARLSLKERLELFVPVCQAVQHAHQKGIIHRDLKPSNILVCLYDGKPVPKVIDFGLAKAMHQSLTEQSIYTAHGMMVGTPLYMSPEQAEQNNLDIDTRTDIYALGVILYELLTGTTPLERAQMKQAAYDEVLRLIKEVEPPKPSMRLSGSASLPSVAAQRGIEPAQLTRSITGDLDWVVMKALEKERSRRYETANGLAEDIRRHLADEPVSASPPSTSYRVRKFIRRNRAGVIAASAIAITLLLGVAGTTGGMFWALEERKDAVAAREAESEAKLDAEENAREAQRQTRLADERLVKETAAARKAEAAVKASRRSLFELNTEIGLIAAEARRPAEALLWFAEAAESVEDGSYEDQACQIRHAAWSESTPRLLCFFEHSGQRLLEIDYDSSGDFLATLTDSGQLTVWDARGWARSVLTRADRVDHVWHPRHPWLITADQEGSVRVIEIPSGRVLHETESREPVSKIAYAPQSEKVAICGKSIQLWDVTAGAISDVSDTGDATVQSASFSGDGSLVLASYDDDRARLFDTESPTGKPLLPPLTHYGTGFPGQPFTPPIFVNQDLGILTKSSGNNIAWTDISTGERQTNIPVLWHNATSLRSSPDGKSFVVTSQEGQYQIWNVLTGEEQVKGFVGGSAWCADFTPDGLDLWVQTVGGIHRRRAVDGEQFGSSITLPASIHHFRVSPNGRRIAIADVDGGVCIWEWGTWFPHHLHAAAPDASGVLPGSFRQHLLPGDASRMKESPSGEYILVRGSNAIFGTRRRIALLSTVDGTVVDSTDSKSLVLDACITTDERTLAFANLDQELHVRQRGASRNQRALATVDSEPLRIEFGPDETTIIVLEIDGTISCVDSLSGATIWQKTHPEVVIPAFRRQTDYHIYRRENGFPYTRFHLYDLLSGKDGGFVVTTCWNDVCCVWNSHDGSLKVPPIQFGEENILNIALSPDGRWLAIAGEHTAEVYDTADGQRQQRFNLSSKSSGLFFDPTGRRLAICVYSGECTVWDWQSHHQSGPVIRANYGVFLGEDSPWFLTDRGLGDDQNSEVTIWNTQTGKPITPSWPINTREAAHLVYSEENRTGYFPTNILTSMPLGHLLDPADRSVKQRKSEAEILSTRRVEQGRAMRLSASEWWQRISSIRQSKPDFFTSGWGSESVITWHQDQLYRGLGDDSSHAARWHSDALSELLGDGYTERYSHEAEVEFLSAFELASAGEIDEAARHIRLIKHEEADLFGLHLGLDGIKTLQARGIELIRLLSSASYKAETKQIGELLLRLLESRFGPNDARVHALNQLLAEGSGE